MFTADRGFATTESSSLSVLQIRRAAERRWAAEGLRDGMMGGYVLDLFLWLGLCPTSFMPHVRASARLSHRCFLSVSALSLKSCFDTCSV